MPIKILSPDVANKIAAGEVVERPASVVKELVENTIDAGSTSVQVEVRAGGKRLIRVSDNGSGMSREDALLALERHATSKIHTIEDLETIQTFGFRGEALPSIASVSQFELLTRTADAVGGTKVVVEGGVVRSVQESGCSPGTHITVNNLFYNVPARLKFLKSETTEVNHITSHVNWAALANPTVQFNLTHNTRTLVDVRACETLMERILLLHGKTFADSLIEFETALPDMKLHCFIGKPDFSKANRNYQLFFLNRRPIRSRILGAALSEAMKSMVSKDRYPVAFLFLTMDATSVDVNVHPAKMEVRFQNERAVYSEVVRILHSGIYKHKYIPKGMGRTGEPTEVEAEAEVANPDAPRLQTQATSTTRTVAPSTVYPNTRREFLQSHSRPSPPSAETPPVHETFQRSAHTVPRGTTLELFDFEGVQLKTSLFNTYIVAEGSDCVFLIDQHVAAERVLYERFVEQVKTQAVPVQGLLLPVTLEGTSQQLTILEAHLDFFKKLGFDIERFGGKTILVRAIPAALPTRLTEETVWDLLDQLSQPTQAQPDILEAQDKALITLACKSAVKAGDSLTVPEMVNLIKDLSKAKLPFNCPHSRPIVVEISREELEKRFKRR